jgi:mannitol/fructose-specific phosphotransferase system IIA component (Ntr-type)
MGDPERPRPLANSLDDLLILSEEGVRTRDQAIDAMLEGLASRGVLPRELVSAVRAAILSRDELGPTGIGEGVAIPHAWHAGLDRMLTTLAVSRRGVDYPSMDGGAVHIILLVLTPPDRTFAQPKQRFFGGWLGRLRNPVFRASLLLAGSRDQLHEAIQAEDPPPGAPLPI